MPKRRRLTMRQLRQLLRLSADGISVRDIATMTWDCPQHGAGQHRASDCRRPFLAVTGGAD